MQQSAQEIRTEVGRLMDDMGRLRERVLKLQQHFGQASDDVSQILISAHKISQRGGRIEAMEFADEAAPHHACVAMPTQIGRKMEAGA
jgi:DNA recombination protein RmuC